MSQPRIGVQSVLQKPQVFEFVIHQRKQYFFGRVGEITTKLEFKALSEDDMIEWMGILQHELKYRYFDVDFVFPADPLLQYLKQQNKSRQMLKILSQICPLNVPQACLPTGKKGQWIN